MNAIDRAKVGEVFWVVVEHFYTPKDSPICEKEYCVCRAEVQKLLPKWDEMVLHGPGPDGYWQLHYYKNKDIGKKVFRTPREAALYALELTNKNDRVWADMMGEKPMRRTWEKYLEENGFPEDYKIDRDAAGKVYPKTKQVARCGNAVPPPFAEALVRANLPELCGGKIQPMAELKDVMTAS